MSVAEMLLAHSLKNNGSSEKEAMLSAKNSSEMNKKGFEMESSTPENNAWEGLADSVGESFGSNQGLIGSFIGGAAKGASAGMKNKRIDEKKSKLDKFKNVQNYLSETTNWITEMNNNKAKEEAGERVLSDLERKFSKDFGSLDANTRAQYPIYAMDEYNKVTGDNGRFIGFLGGNPRAWIIENKDTGQQKVVDFSQLDGGLDPKAMQKQLIMEAKEMEQRKLAQTDMQLSIARQNADSITQNNQFRADPTAQGSVEGAKALARANPATIKEASESLDKGYSELQSIDRMEEVIKSSNLAGRPALIWMTKGLGLQPTNAESNVQLMKMLSMGFMDGMKKIYGGIISDSEREHFLAMMPSLDKNPKAALEILDMMRTRVLNWNERKRRQISAYHQDKGANLHTDTSDITKPNSVMNSPQSQPGMLRVKLPNGKITNSSIEKYNQMLRDGLSLEIVQ